MRSFAEEPKIQSVMFGDRLEVTYIEPRNIDSVAGMEVTTLVINPDVVAEEYADLRDSVLSLIDRYLEVRRNPAATIRR